MIKILLKNTKYLHFILSAVFIFVGLCQRTLSLNLFFFFFAWVQVALFFLSHYKCYKTYPNFLRGLFDCFFLPFMVRRKYLTYIASCDDVRAKINRLALFIGKDALNSSMYISANKMDSFSRNNYPLLCDCYICLYINYEGDVNYPDYIHQVFLSLAKESFIGRYNLLPDKTMRAIDHDEKSNG